MSNISEIGQPGAAAQLGGRCRCFSAKQGDLLNTISTWVGPNLNERVHFLGGGARAWPANAGLLGRDIRLSQRARETVLLTEIPIDDLTAMMKRAADFYLNDSLSIGNGEQSPDDFARQQSASTGLPEHLCKANMKKNHFVLSNMDQDSDALTRGLPICDVLTSGYGVEGQRGRHGEAAGPGARAGPCVAIQFTGVHTFGCP